MLSQLGYSKSWAKSLDKARSVRHSRWVVRLLQWVADPESGKNVTKHTRQANIEFSLMWLTGITGR